MTVRAQQQAEGIDLWQKAEESLFLNPIPRASPTVADEADLKRGLGSPPSDLNAPPPPAHQWFSREKVSIKKPVKSYLVKTQCRSYLTNFNVSLMKKLNFLRLCHLTEKSNIRLFLTSKVIFSWKSRINFWQSASEQIVVLQKTSQISVMQWSDEFFCCLH